MSLRTFIAFDIYPDHRLAAAIRQLRQHFRSDLIRWVKTDPLHVTLAFMASISRADAELVSALLRERLRDFPAFDVTVRGLGFFGRPASPRVLWAGIESSDNLTRLHGIVRDLVRAAGQDTEDRPFSPHLTLGRVKEFTGRHRIDGLPQEIREEVLMEARISEIIFYRSILAEKGARYEPVSVVPLSD